MPHFCFVNQTPVPAGFVERICAYSPWTKTQAMQTPNGVVQLDPLQAAWNAIQQLAAQNGWAFAEGVNYAPQITNKVTDMGPAFKVYCIQFAQPGVERTQVNAPYGVPVGNGRQLTMPPMAKRERDVPQGAYEQVDSCALPTTPGDGLLSEMDGEGGTFTDLDSLGNEVVRHEFMPQSQPRTPRVG